MSHPAAAADNRIDPRLRILMFLQYTVLGVWMPILPSYLKADVAAGGLGFNGYEVGWIIAVAPALGAIVSPFIAGQLTDRFVSTEYYLAGALLVCGILQWWLSFQTSFAAWAALSIAQAVAFFPTLGLSNSLAMAHLANPPRQFPRVRVWGTLGWIAVAWAFPLLFLQRNVEPTWLPPFFLGEDRLDATNRIVLALRASGSLAFVAAVFSLRLPHTPPRRSAPDRLAFVGVSRLLKRRSVAVLVLCALVVAAIDRIYFLQTAPYLQAIGLQTIYVMPAMAIGQLTEIVVMTSLGFLLARWGFRPVLGLGALAYFLRYAIFGTTGLPTEVIVAGLSLHGVCFPCFFTSAVIYLNHMAADDVRHSAQTGFTLVAMGPGAMLGGWLNGLLEQQFAEAGALDYSGFWYACAGIGLCVAVVVVCLFRDETGAEA